MAALRSTFAVLIVGLSLLAGCTPADPAGQPTYSCTPDDGSSPYPCHKVQYDAKAKEAALYAEAEAVYRKFFAEDERINRVGGANEPTPVILETTTGRFQTDVMAGYRNLLAIHGTATGGEFKIAWIKRQPKDSLDGSIVALLACTDASSVQMGARGKTPVAGPVIQYIGYFVRDGAALKLTAARSKVVSSC
ncbi:MAG: hypothetical protein CVT62_12735 [Actinobacteria bacterium HGW-Actinobacteria-2]|nr:MAG: hypothetical protein CVT62_12735 [Actinobacteria bacterium HGW-Actinobacteria-2]